MQHDNPFLTNQSGFSDNGQQIICHQYYVEQPFCPPIRKPKCEASTIDKVKFYRSSSNARMVAEVTELIPQLAEEIKDMNVDQFMEVYALAMQEKKKVEQYKAAKRTEAPKDSKDGSKSKNSAMERQWKEASKLKSAFAEERLNPKRTHDTMMSTNPSKPINRQPSNNQQLAKQNKYSIMNSPFERQIRKIKIPQKLTRQVQIDQHDGDLVVEDEGKCHKRIHKEDYQVCKKTRYQASSKSNPSPTPSKDPKGGLLKTRQQ